MPDRRRILILGGTAEARLLAERLAADSRYVPLTSLAGVTRTREIIPGEVRIGGFGGADGLAAFIRNEGIAVVVDATHPFAAQISAHAAAACEKTGVPCLRLEREPWAGHKGDVWIVVPDVAAAARTVPAGARALVTVGRKEIARFFAREDITVVARMIEPPEAPVPAHADVLLARPPFTLDEETALMREEGITVLVAKNAGGAATYAKIEAARALGLPVIMVARPEKPAVTAAAGIDELMCGIAAKCG